MKYFKISEEIIEALIKYLNGRPYIEVRDGMKALEGLEEVKDAIAAPEKSNHGI